MSVKVENRERVQEIESGSKSFAVRMKEWVLVGGAIIGLIGGSAGIYEQFREWGERGIVLAAERRQAEDRRQITRLMDQEAAATLSQDIDAVLAIYASGSAILQADRNGTRHWAGKEEIRGRYADVFRGEKFSTNLGHADKHIVLEGNDAIARADTIGKLFKNGVWVDISSNQGEKWSFKRIHGKWRVITFAYGMRGLVE